MRKLIVANWKCHPDSVQEAVSLAKKVHEGVRNAKNAEIVIAPPFSYLASLIIRHPSLKWGAQDAFWENSGAYTGEVGPAMLKSLGVQYVIIGHSERRRILGETDDMVNKKLLACLKAGLNVILCVGEPEQKGIENAKRFVQEQLKKDLKGIKNIKKLVIAYEPVWAISGSGGKADNPKDALEMVKFIKSLLHTTYHLLPTVLYGGSVNSQNAESFLQYKEVDGALVGGASLKPAEFKKIIESAS
jgi:triosephosphate isomerase (TIM)